MHLDRFLLPSPNPAAVQGDAPWCDLPSDVLAVLAAGVHSSRLVFPENGPPRRVEQWRAPVISDPALSARLLACLRTVEQATMPAQRGPLLSRVLALLSHYRAEPHAPAVEALLADDWAEDLGHYPLWAVEEAARQWRRTRRFRPQISEMVALCDAACAEQLRLRARLREVVGASEITGSPFGQRTAVLARGALRRVPSDTRD